MTVHNYFVQYFSRSDRTANVCLHPAGISPGHSQDALLTPEKITLILGHFKRKTLHIFNISVTAFTKNIINVSL